MPASLALTAGTRRIIILTALLGLIPAIWAGQARAQDSAPVMLKASKVLPAGLVQGPDYRVEEDVRSDGFVNTYRVKSRFGDFTAVSTPNLRVLVTEIKAMAAMSQVEKTKAFKDSLVDSGKGTVKTVTNAVRHPMDTLAGTAGGLGKMFQRMGDSVTQTRSKSEDSRMQDIIGFSRAKREVAAKFGVDPYSDNKALQEHLDSLAWAEYAGGLTVSGALAVVPGAAGIAVSATGGTKLLNGMYVTQTASDLRRMNEKKLLDMNIPGQTVDMFMEVSDFSPTYQTGLVAALEGLDNVEGRDDYLAFAMRVSGDRRTNLVPRMAELLAAYHRKVAPIARLVRARNLMAAMTREGDFVLVLPLDYLLPSQSLNMAMELMTARAKELKARRMVFAATGVMAPAAKAKLKALGWQAEDGLEAKLLEENS
jgi:hypothetical protein